jgi:hypothetical protein
MNTGSKPESFMGGTTRETEFIDSPEGCKAGERRCEEKSPSLALWKAATLLGMAIF